MTANFRRDRSHIAATATLALAVALLYYASHPLLLCRQIIIRDDEALYARLKLGDNLPYGWLTESDYTFRFADALLDGQLGLTKPPPEWVNEIIPLNGKYFSVFPLGSVLTMLPFAAAHRIVTFPVAGVAIIFIGGLAAVLFFQLASSYGRSPRDACVLTLFATAGTWLWTNTVMGGAWQLALGFAMIGQLAAIYFTRVRPKPFLAGCCFAFAFGNRTEVILTAPIFFYFLTKPPSFQVTPLNMLTRFGIAPLAIGAATLAYNFARFGSPFDFGLARLPGVLDEPWYRHGIFSIYAIPDNAWEMLFAPWRRVSHWPYMLPTGFGGSIFLNAPFLLYIFRRGARYPHVKIAAWIGVAVFTAIFWCHGNTGGWQFSYRGAILMLPWFFLLLLESSPPDISRLQAGLIATSLFINACATYLFLWTNLVEP